jgi:drug/metabolite transporter (DMT)-like permease
MALTASALWGTLGVFAKAIYRYNIDSLVLVTMRAGIAFVVLLVIMLFRSPGLLKVEPRDLIDFAYVGIVGIALEYWVYFETLKRTSSSVASILLYTAPVFVTAGAAAFFGERITRRGLAALGVVLIGGFLVAGGLEARVLAQDRSGVLFGLASAVTYASYTLLSKRTLPKYGSWTTVLYAFGFGTVLLALMSGPKLVQLARVPFEGWVLMLGLALGPTLLSYGLYVMSLEHIQASRATVICMMEPVTASILGFLALGERLAGWQLAGALLVLGGVGAMNARAIPPAPGDVVSVEGSD